MLPKLKKNKLEEEPDAVQHVATINATLIAWKENLNPPSMLFLYDVYQKLFSSRQKPTRKFFRGHFHQVYLLGTRESEPDVIAQRLKTEY